MTLLYLLGDKELYSAILYRWGIVPYRFQFLDFHNSLAAWECLRRGVDVIASNPCDDLGRGYIYGPIWLSFSFIPLGIDDAWWTGWLLAVGFLVSLAFLPSVKQPWQLTAMVAGCLSPMVVFAVERANADIIVFMLSVAIGNLAGRAPFAGYALIVIGGLFKYYPAAMFILTLRERASVFLATTGAAVCLGILFLVIYSDELGRALIPRGPYFTDLFAAKNLPLGIATLVPVSATLVLIGLLLAFQLAVLAIARGNSFPALAGRHYVFLIIGSALIVGCFFAGQSIAYRGIMFLMVLPGLLCMAEQSRLAFFTSAGIVLLMWDGFVRHLFGDEFAPLPYWLIRELLWWWVVAVLSAILVDFAAKSPVLNFVRRLKTLKALPPS